MADRDDRFLGPLGSLLADLDAGPDSTASDPLHPSVLDLDAEGGAALGVVCWDAPEDATSLNRMLRPVVEGALLAELSLPSSQARPRERRLRALYLLDYAGLDARFDAALAPFGWLGATPAPLSSAALALLRGEALRARRDAPDEPRAVRRAGVEVATGQEPVPIDAIEETLRQRAGDEAFGQRPGAPFARLADALAPYVGVRLEPTLDGLRRLERVLVGTQREVVRLLPPLVFQALCDAVAVVAVRALGKQVQWAESTPEEDGFVPPPLVRAKLADGWAHVPVGMHLLRWCVMPLQRNERPESIVEWTVFQFGS